VPALVVQGARDPFGVPPEAPARAVVRVDSDHGLRTDLRAVAAAVGAWLRALPSSAPAEPAPILPGRGTGRAVD
jgi:hypothetical protein